MNNIVFSSNIRNNDPNDPARGQCKENDIEPYNNVTWAIATEKIKIIIATENDTWINNNILTNNGNLPVSGGKYGIRFERVKKGKWTGIPKFLFIPFNSSNMDCVIPPYITTSNSHKIFTYVFTLKSITTKSLSDELLEFPNNYGYTHTFKLGSKSGSSWVKYDGKKVYIKGQANSLTSYSLENPNSYYSYNRHSTLTNIKITNRFSAKMRVVFCTYNEISENNYKYTIPVYINSVEFNLVIGLTKSESSVGDKYNGSTYLKSNSDIVFIRGKQSRGRIPVTFDDFGV